MIHVGNFSQKCMQRLRIRGTQSFYSKSLSPHKSEIFLKAWFVVYGRQYLLYLRLLRKQVLPLNLQWKRKFWKQFSPLPSSPISSPISLLFSNFFIIVGFVIDSFPYSNMLWQNHPLHDNETILEDNIHMQVAKISINTNSKNMRGIFWRLSS